MRPPPKGAKKAIKPMFKRNKWNILRGDTVMILTGKDRDQTGTVTKVIRDERTPRVIVSGINLQKRHIKRTESNPGGIISVEGPIHYSNVALIDPVTKKAIRVARRFLEDGTKVRISRGKNASGSVIPRPAILKERRNPRPEGPRDTPRAVAEKVTYTPGEWPSFPKLPPGPRHFSTASLSSLEQQLASLSFSSRLHVRRRDFLSGSCGFAALTSFPASRTW